LSQPLEAWKSIPGYPNERQGFWAVFLTRQTVLIVPAAPSRDATATAAVWSAQRAIVVVDVVEVLVVVAVVVASVGWPVEVGGLEAVPVGTGPASCAPPPPQPATTNARARVEVSALIMLWSVPRARNSAGELL
jgi:hypothetical protein